ncbi:MAG: LLM class F420-dependent oxidoreductase [Acidimicrobiales bacterium]
MRIGVVLPQIDLPDPRHMVAVAKRAEERGLDHVLVYDHVLGADRDVLPGFAGPYDRNDPFHEPFVFLGYLAAQVSLEMWTGVLILPQRQTALVAKQAAELDVLCDGKLRLGIGVGWNPVEYEALGEDFANRGARYEEQIELLRLLWTEEVVDFRGQWHKVVGAGLKPMPLQRPVPLWMGGLPVPKVLERIGRCGDGWIALTTPGKGLEEAWATVQHAAAAAGRPDGAVGLHGLIQPGDDLSPERLRRQAARWEALGASHLSASGLGSKRHVEEHLAFVDAVASALVG